jgi:hypothetical protein
VPLLMQRVTGQEAYSTADENTGQLRLPRGRIEQPLTSCQGPLRCVRCVPAKGLRQVKKKRHRSGDLYYYFLVSLRDAKNSCRCSQLIEFMERSSARRDDGNQNHASLFGDLIAVRARNLLNQPMGSQ